MTKQNSYDILIIGAGAAGLSFARALGDSGLRICLLERQPLRMLTDPPLDGRDTALTHDSIRLFGELGFLPHIPTDEIAPIRKAEVMNGTSSYLLGFDTGASGKEALGFLVPNNAIRKAAYLAVKDCANVKIMPDVEVKAITTRDTHGEVRLSNGKILTASLVVAADSRFSHSRQAMGITASVTEFGRSAIVCRMTHDHAHDGIARECFFYDRTIAILPLLGNKSSIVMTLTDDKAKAVMKLSRDDFGASVMEGLDGRLGNMRLIGERYAYPLTAVYADRFTGPRFALMGDAAVGMHPVTAHGYNLGLHGAALLADQIVKAKEIGLDIGSFSVLDAYDRGHRRASITLYRGTNALVHLFTDTRPAAKLLRGLALRLGNNLPPFRSYVTRQLTG
jgi:ubiquinone biosynthesis UbiH/UbiF/VisC/COQ6 family hydroxylase